MSTASAISAAPSGSRTVARDAGMRDVLRENDAAGLPALVLCHDHAFPPGFPARLDARWHSGFAHHARGRPPFGPGDGSSTPQPRHLPGRRTGSGAESRTNRAARRSMPRPGWSSARATNRRATSARSSVTRLPSLDVPGASHVHTWRQLDGSCCGRFKAAERRDPRPAPSRMACTAARKRSH